MSNNQPEWERKLEQMRARRGKIAPVGEAAAPEPEAAPKNHRAHAEYKKQILQNYLKNWQNRHNAALAGELTETDATVLLEEDWLNAQNALQGNVKAQNVLDKQTVWFTPKHHAAPQAQSGTEGEKDGEAAAAFSPQDIPVSVNVLDPQGVPASRPVFCLSEQELVERLLHRLMPHLTDAVNGLVRTAITRQAANLNQQLYQAVQSEMPDLVKDILDYNLKNVLTELKYDVKYNSK